MNEIDRQNERLIQQHNSENDFWHEASKRREEKIRLETNFAQTQRETIRNHFPADSLAARLTEPVVDRDYRDDSDNLLSTSAVVTPEMAQDILSRRDNVNRNIIPDPPPPKNPAPAIKLHTGNVSRVHMDLSFGHIRIARDEPFTIWPDRLTPNDLALIQKVVNIGQLKMEYMDGSEASTLEENPIGDGPEISKFDFLADDNNES